MSEKEQPMKPFWDNMFCDLDGGESRENVACNAGGSIKRDLDNIEDAIRQFSILKAFDLIDRLRKEM